MPVLGPTGGLRERGATCNTCKIGCATVLALLARSTAGNKTSEGDRQSSPTMGALLSRMLEVFYTKKLEVVLVGLENRSARLLLLAAVP